VLTIVCHFGSSPVLNEQKGNPRQNSCIQ